jgi:TM2 domain-containing membrane protein YozV
MKTLRLLSLAGLSAALILSSCSMDKKVYSSGYHIEWNGKKHNPEKVTPVQYAAVEKEQVNVNAQHVEMPELAAASEIGANDNLSASTDKSIIIAKTEKINFNTTSAKAVNTEAAASTPKATSAEVKSVSELKTIAKQQKKENKKASALKRKAAAAGGGGKSQLIALLLCIFLGVLGIHRFYLGYTGLGIMYLLFAIIGIPLSAILIGLPLVAALAILILIDLIRIIIGSLKPKHGEYASKL